MRKRKYKKLPKPLKKFFKKESDGTYSKKESKPERECRLILDAIGYDYEQEFNIKYKKYNKYYDFFVFSKDKNIAFVIECHSYWHHQDGVKEYQLLVEEQNKQAKKKKRIRKKMTKTQKRNVRNDKIKAGILKQLDIPLIVIWQYEIEHFPKRVVERIKKEWKRQEQTQI